MMGRRRGRNGGERGGGPREAGQTPTREVFRARNLALGSARGATLAREEADPMRLETALVHAGEPRPRIEGAVAKAVLSVFVVVSNYFFSKFVIFKRK